MALSVIEGALFSCVRIETSPNNGVGTGFLAALFDAGGTHVPVLFTNKHVVAGTQKVRIYLHKAQAVQDESTRTIEAPFSVEGTFHWFDHPDPDVYLCGTLFVPILDHIRRELGIEVFYKTIPKVIVPSHAQLIDLDAAEEILMIGYPSGLWDPNSGLPLMRRGVSALPLRINYLGKNQVLVDIPSFWGSSGSPVFQYTKGAMVDRNHTATFGSRIHFVGVMYATHVVKVNGEVHTKPIPTAHGVDVSTQIPNNLALCIRSDELWKFESIIPPPAGWVPAS